MTDSPEAVLYRYVSVINNEAFDADEQPNLLVQLTTAFFISHNQLLRNLFAAS